MRRSRLLQLASLVLAAAALPAQAIDGGTATTAFGQVNGGVLIASNWVLTARHLDYTVGSTYSNGYGSSTVAAFYTAGSGDYPFADLMLLRLDKIITGAFKGIWETAELHKISLRTAAFTVACTRVLEAREERGLYP